MNKDKIGKERIFEIVHCPFEGRAKLHHYSQVPRTESIPLRIATMMSKIKYEIKQYEDLKFEERINFHLVLLELPVKQNRPILP